MENLISLCIENKASFQAGNLSSRIQEWNAITFNPKILQLVKGVKILEQDEDINAKEVSNFSLNYDLSDFDIERISKEIKDMLDKGIILETDKEEGDILSKIFYREKSDGKNIRIILNLKKLNSKLSTNKFKMTGINQALDLVRPNC